MGKEALNKPEWFKAMQ